ncbi:MAG: SBBP repeat-containing protein [Bacteroidia bacterium]|nr:SBBP repeat-containing protein [Bacteroidia bacterium]
MAQSINYQWAKGIGNSGSEAGYCIKEDFSGNVYVCGKFRLTVDFDPSAGIANLTSNGNEDFFLAKYNSSGNYVWAKSIGGTGSESAQSIAIDNAGNILVTGYFFYTVDFDPSVGLANMTSVGASDFFIAKYDNNGNYVWSKSAGLVNGDGGYSITLDLVGNAYTTGNSNGGDIFIRKYDIGGTLQWEKMISGAYSENGECIVYNNGNIYLTGYFRGIVDFDPSASTANLATTSGIDGDVFIASYDTNGNYNWAKSFGSASANDYGHSVAVDGLGDLYICGDYRSTVDFDPSGGISNLTSLGGSDMFITKFTPTGTFIWAKSIGGVNNDTGLGLAIDNSNNVYVTGWFYETVDFDPSAAGVATITSTGMGDLYIAKYDLNGNYLLAVNMGGTASEQGNSIALNNTTIYLTGSFQSNSCDFDPSNGVAAVTNSFAPTDEIFICKYTQTTATKINENTFNEETIQIYPNPVINDVNILSSSEIVKVEVINLLGEVVLKKDLSPIKEASVDIHLIDGGYYFIRIYTQDSGVTIKKIMKY